MYKELATKEEEQRKNENQHQRKRKWIKVILETTKYDSVSYNLEGNRIKYIWHETEKKRF